MSDKKELIVKFWKYAIVIFLLGVGLCGIAFYFNPTKMDISFIKDVYSFLFSILAPLFAVYLYSDWKDQKRYDLEKEQLSLALTQLTKISTDLYKSRSDIHQISKVDKQIVYVRSYLKRKEFDHVHELFTLYGYINNYCLIKNKDDLKERYNDLEKHCYNFYSTKQNILHKYEKYLNKLDEIDPTFKESLEFNKNYDEILKQSVISEISSILLITDFEQKYTLTDINECVLKEVLLKPYDLVNQTIDLTNSLIKECNTKILP